MMDGTKMALNQKGQSSKAIGIIIGLIIGLIIVVLVVLKLRSTTEAGEAGLFSCESKGGNCGYATKPDCRDAGGTPDNTFKCEGEKICCFLTAVS